MIRNAVKLPKQLEELHKKQDMLFSIIEGIKKEIDTEYRKLTDNITVKENRNSTTLVYNEIQFNIKSLRRKNGYSITKNGHRLSFRTYSNLDTIKMDIVKGIL